MARIMDFILYAKGTIWKVFEQGKDLIWIIFKKQLSGYCKEDGLQWDRGRGPETTQAGVIINRNSKEILELRSSFIG